MTMKEFLKIVLCLVALNVVVSLLFSIMVWKFLPCEYYLGLLRVILAEIILAGIIVLCHNRFKRKKG